MHRKKPPTDRSGGGGESECALATPGGLAILAGMSRLSLSALAFLLVLRSAGATENALSHLLTPEAFSRAGLDKLTPAELDDLAAVLARHQQLPIPPPASAGRSDAPASRAAIHAPTAGGESVFG